jgi:hypothetical protein
MTINNELLAKFEGKCWHKTTNEYPFRCAICGQSETDWQGWFICPHNPDYSTSPADRGRLWEYLMGKEEMWNSFLDWSVKQYWRPQTKADRGFFPWLFSPLDGVPRWVSLLSEWLGMDSTVERFGWVECQYKKEWPRTKPDGKSTFFCELECNKKDIPSCNGTGRVRAEWAR